MLKSAALSGVSLIAAIALINACTPAGVEAKQEGQEQEGPTQAEPTATQPVAAATSSSPAPQAASALAAQAAPTPTPAAAASLATRPADFAFWPGAQYTADIPTLESVVGHANGERITSPADAITYLQALAADQPDRVRLVEYARTWEGRPLVYAVIGTPERIAELDTIKAGMQSLADPRKTSEEDAAALIDSLPASVWIAYGVHGNEISSTDAGLMTAYHLLAAINDPVVEKILSQTIVVIDPMQNPDGRARFVHNYETTAGLAPSGSRIAAERNEPWPGGRTNHYLFDMNRDWFALTQPETIGRVNALREWKPLIFVDAHEMGSNSTYYFTPEAVPYNPHLAPSQRSRLDLIGRNNAKWFDQNGFDYFTREVYDAFFPGYGASWPAYYGALAMTYEQASSRGMMADRDNGTSFHYRDTVRQHFVASMSTAEAAADNRETLLKDFWAYQKSAIKEGRDEDIKTYIFPARTDKSAADKLAGLLARQGVEVKTATSSFSACGTTHPAGAQVISLAQPAKRLVRTLLDPVVEMNEEFLAEQERLRAKGLPDQIYDVTAWSLPLLHNVEMASCNAAVGDGDGFVMHSGDASPGAGVVDLEPGKPAIAYLVNWGERPAALLLGRALEMGLEAKSSDKAFTMQGKTFSAGTVIFNAKANPADVRATLDALSKETGAGVTAVATSWVEDGPNFGSGNVVRLHMPKIAMAWDAPANPYQAGNTRFVIERQLGLPVTPIRARHLTDRALAEFDVLILPGESSWYGGGYSSVLGEEAGPIGEWVRNGGTLIAVSGAMRWASDPKVGLLSVRREMAATDEEAPAETPEEEKATVAGTLITSAEEAVASLEPAETSPDPIAGVLARASVDPDHWMGVGLKPELISLLGGSDIYTPATLDKGVNVARFKGPDEIVASGYAWDETAKQFAYKPFVVAESVGAGTVIGFTQDPAFRAQMDGLNVLLANALYGGPAHSGKLR